MMRRRFYLTLLLLGLLCGTWFYPARAQTEAPLAFADPTPDKITWPGSVEIEVLNNTTQSLTVSVELTTFVDPTSGVSVEPASLLQSLIPSFTLPPAGQTTLTLATASGAQPEPGKYTASLVLAVLSHNAVLRKPITIEVPETITVGETSLPDSLRPAVERWTLKAVRFLPFADPACVRGVLLGCTLPLDGKPVALEDPMPVGQLVNEEGGGGLLVSVREASDHYALLDLAFDRPWGLVGNYTGVVDLVPGDPDAGIVEMSVHVKDSIVWPLLALWLGVTAARHLQRYLTVRRDVLGLLQRLNALSLEFGKLRRSIFGYSVSEDFHQQRAALEEAIRAWDRSHYGPPTDIEMGMLQHRIIEPLEALESQLEIWKTMRQRLDRLGRRLAMEARPVIAKATKPRGVDVPEPRFYTTARSLLRGRAICMADLPELASRVDQAAELASLWGGLYRLACLVRDAIRELTRPTVTLSESERAMLETARHRLNSAVRDLWEVRDLQELRIRETQEKLETAQELTRQLMDPFVYGRRIPVSGRALTDEEFAFSSVESGAEIAPLVRVFSHIDSFRLPHLDLDRYEALQSDSQRSEYLQRAVLFSERAVASVAMVTAVVAGLERYFSTDFGSPADYLALLIYGVATKAGLELINAAVSRLLARFGSQ
ncbi:MAG TPA: hypothetical protein ENL34_13565 [Chloroflexi bacterium]|nr:hypothetical protein [Chloroflexota bacterium]